MSDKRKTAVEWLIQQLTERYVSDITPEEWFGIMGQAKALEREQIEEAYEVGFADGFDDARYDNEPKYAGAEQFYEQTYGK